MSPHACPPSVRSIHFGSRGCTRNLCPPAPLLCSRQPHSVRNRDFEIAPTLAPAAPEPPEYEHSARHGDNSQHQRKWNIQEQPCTATVDVHASVQDGIIPQHDVEFATCC